MNISRTLFSLVAVSIIAALFVACGDSGDGSTTDSDPLATLRAGQSASPTPRGGAVAQPSTTPPANVSGDVSARCGSGDAGGIGAIQRTGQRTFDAAPKMVIDAARTYTAKLVTNKGEVTLLLAAKDVPLTVNNFVFLACTGYYDGLTFHRVELNPPFVIQGGDPNGNGSGGPGYRINLEISTRWRHDTGALAMARSSDPNSAGSQFYITLAPQPSLDNAYAVFGRVLTGMEIVRNIRVGDVMTRIDIEQH